MIAPANQIVEFGVLPLVHTDSPLLQKLATDALHAYIAGKVVETKAKW